jgi:hypothetical protein
MEIIKLQSTLKDKPLGERIALWAEKFVGAPYDNDPQGEYVTRKIIVADERVDCMYLTFRAVELALSSTPENASRIALDKRFHSKGIVVDGEVINYDNRFEYGEDMIYSGKWGKEITSEVGKTIKITGSRGKGLIDILTVKELNKRIKSLKSGDIIFFIKDPKKRTREEIVGHIGIVKAEGRKQSASGGTEDSKEYKEIYLIHAGGIKGKGGVVKKILLEDYIKQMPFIGAKITRFY